MTEEFKHLFILWWKSALHIKWAQIWQLKIFLILVLMKENKWWNWENNKVKFCVKKAFFRILVI